MPIDFSRFSVGDMREFLIQEDYDEEQVKSLKKLELVTFIKENSLEDKLALFQEEDELDNAELDPEEIEMITHAETPVIPSKGSPEWNDYVLSQFTEDEYVEVTVDNDKKIKGLKCDGLRRVAQKVLGPIISSGANNVHVQYPDYQINGKEQYAKMQIVPCAWVSYSIIFSTPFGNVTWGGTADVNYLNTDPKFIPFALATAETRAEARALRKALGIKVLAAEELTSQDNQSKMEVITNADWLPGQITDSQKAVINRMCQKLNISVYKLINCDRASVKDGPVKYTGVDKRNESLDSLNNEQAAKVVSLLNEIQRDVKQVDSSILEN